MPHTPRHKGKKRRPTRIFEQPIEAPSELVGMQRREAVKLAAAMERQGTLGPGFERHITEADAGPMPLTPENITQRAEWKKNLAAKKARIAEGVTEPPRPLGEGRVRQGLGQIAGMLSALGLGEAGIDPEVAKNVTSMLDFIFPDSLTPEERDDAIDWVRNTRRGWDDVPKGGLGIYLSMSVIPGVGDVQALQDIKRDFHAGTMSLLNLVDAASVIPFFGVLLGTVAHSGDIARAMQRFGRYSSDPLTFLEREGPHALDVAGLADAPAGERRMYHVTTNADEVYESGRLKSRMELAGEMGDPGGLGGGPANTASVTYSPEHAQMVEERMRLAVRAARREASPKEIVDYFSTQMMGDNPFEVMNNWTNVVSSSGPDTGVRDFYRWAAEMNGHLPTDDEIANGMFYDYLEAAYEAHPYQLVQDYDATVSEIGALNEGFWGDKYTGNPYGVGLLAREDAMARIDPNQIATVEVMAKPEARVEWIPHEQEIRLQPEGTVVVPRLPEPEEGTVRVYRRTPGETSLDPRDPAARTGHAGAEEARREARPDVYPPRLSYYVAESRAPEPRFQRMQIETHVDVPRNALYDIRSDPEGLIGGMDFTEFERYVADHPQLRGIIDPETGRVDLYDDAADLAVGRIDLTTGKLLDRPKPTAPPPGAGPRGRGARVFEGAQPPEVTDWDIEMAERLNRGEGVTQRLDGSSPPKSERYIVSPSKDTETIFRKGEVTPLDVATFREAHGGALGNGYFGAWVDGDDVYMDVSRGFSKKSDALAVAAAGDQRTIADLRKIEAGDWDNAFPENPYYNPGTDTTVWPDERVRVENRARVLKAMPELDEALDAAMVRNMGPQTREWFEGSRNHIKDRVREMYRMNLTDEEMATLMALGGQTRGWYEGAGRALRQAYGPDAEQFMALLAATSPNVPVESNIRFAEDLWAEWNHWGRPKDEGAIQAMFDSVAEGTGINKLEGHQVVPNANKNVITVLGFPDNPADYFGDPEVWRRGDVLSGTKVDPFFANVAGELDRATIDTHMLALAPSPALGLSRRAAQEASLGGGARTLSEALQMPEPLRIAEGQEMAWEPIRQLNEMAGRGRQSVEELLFDAEGNLRLDTLEELDRRMGEAQDFSQLIRTEESRRLIGAAGGNPEVDVPHRQGLGPFTGAARRRVLDNPEHLRAIARRIDMRNAGDFMYSAAPLLAAGGAGALGRAFTDRQQDQTAEVPSLFQLPKKAGGFF